MAPECDIISLGLTLKQILIWSGPHISGLDQIRIYLKNKIFLTSVVGHGIILQIFCPHVLKNNVGSIDLTLYMITCEKIHEWPYREM